MAYTIYLRTNKVNGMQYVGQTKDFIQRERSWKCLKLRYANWYITEDREKYGLDNFEITILAEAETREEAWELEQKYINELGTKYPNGYNMSDGGATNKGFSFTEEVRKLISENTKKAMSRKEVKQKLSEAKKGKHNSPDTEYKKGMTPWIKGKKHSEESKKKMSESLKGHIPWNKGKKGCYSEETIRKMSEKRKGRISKQRKPISQYDLDGNFIKTWPSISEIQLKLGFHNSAIIRCCKGKLNQAYGSIWKYADQD